MSDRRAVRAAVTHVCAIWHKERMVSRGATHGGDFLKKSSHAIFLKNTTACPFTPFGLCACTKAKKTVKAQTRKAHRKVTNTLHKRKNERYGSSYCRGVVFENRAPARMKSYPVAGKVRNGRPRGLPAPTVLRRNGILTGRRDSNDKS